MTTEPLDFDRLYADNPDPWSFRSRWYEARKRELILACLPTRQYRSAFEPACANGELSAELAGRSYSLLCSDASPRAVELARERLAEHANVRLAVARLPQQWPAERFDLIVLGELGYYLAPADWRHVIERARSSLLPGGTLLACHWREPIEGCALDGDGVHQVLHEVLGTPAIAHHEHCFRLELWCDDLTPEAA